jgi:hypothetical protein
MVNNYDDNDTMIDDDDNDDDDNDDPWHYSPDGCKPLLLWFHSLRMYGETSFKTERKMFKDGKE